MSKYLKTPHRKKTLDRIDRSILRFMHRSKRPISAHRIADRIRISCPTVTPRLRNLKRQGIVKVVQVGKPRKYKRVFTNPKTHISKTRNIIAPSKMLWGIDLIKKRKKTK